MTSQAEELRRPGGDEAGENFSVKYRTERGLAYALDEMFYCKNCEVISEGGTNRARLKGPLDVEEEIDSLFCSGCLEVVPAVEASLFGFRCAKCYTCPLCSSFLQTASVACEGDGDGERFFFACGFCKWESISVGIEAPEASGLVLTCLKRERDDPLDRQVQATADDMAALLVTQPSSKPQWAARAPARAPSRPAPPAESPPAASDTPLQEGALASTAQRLRMPATQPALSASLRPTRSPLRSRCSRRCLDCSRIISKPDPSPQSTRFRVNMAAAILVPSIAFEPPPVWEEGVQAEVTLWLKNPRHVPAVLWVAQLPASGGGGGKSVGLATIQFGGGGRSWVGALPDVEGEWEEGGGHRVPGWVEEAGGVAGGVDVESLVAWRTENVVALKAKVTPPAAVGPVKVAVRMQVQYQEDGAAWWVQADLELGAVHPKEDSASESSL